MFEFPDEMLEFFEPGEGAEAALHAAVSTATPTKKASSPVRGGRVRQRLRRPPVSQFICVPPDHEVAVVAMVMLRVQMSESAHSGSASATPTPMLRSDRSVQTRFSRRHLGVGGVPGICWMIGPMA
jgi:hypothetical protein